VLEEGRGKKREKWYFLLNISFHLESRKKGRKKKKKKKRRRSRKNGA